MAACNAIFLLLVVSLLYKGSICDEQQLEALEKKLQVLEQKLLDMENKQHTESRKLHRTIETMNQVTNQQHQCEQKLEKESMKLHQTIAAVDEVKVENQNSLKELGVTKALFLQAMEKVDEVSEKVGKLSTPVAFTASMTNSFRPTLSHDIYAKLPFNNVHVNIGNGYSVSKYSFICPVSGMYYFSFSVHSGVLESYSDASQSLAYIYHKWYRVSGGYSATFNNHDTMQVQTAASAVIRCEVGDYVNVKSGDYSHNQFLSSSSRPLSTFTGFLISPL